MLKTRIHMLTTIIVLVSQMTVGGYFSLFNVIIRSALFSSHISFGDKRGVVELSMLKVPGEFLYGIQGLALSSKSLKIGMCQFNRELMGAYENTHYISFSRLY